MGWLCAKLLKVLSVYIEKVKEPAFKKCASLVCVLVFKTVLGSQTVALWSQERKPQEQPHARLLSRRLKVFLCDQGASLLQRHPVQRQTEEVSPADPPLRMQVTVALSICATLAASMILTVPAPPQGVIENANPELFGFGRADDLVTAGLPSGGWSGLWVDWDDKGRRG